MEINNKVLIVGFSCLLIGILMSFVVAEIVSPENNSTANIGTINADVKDISLVQNWMGDLEVVIRWQTTHERWVYEIWDERNRLRASGNVTGDKSLNETERNLISDQILSSFITVKAESVRLTAKEDLNDSKYVLPTRIKREYPKP